jgi:hypothetical protein
MEYREFVKCVERLWRESGASEMRHSCIEAGHGCCDSRCSNHTNLGCKDKPLPCALWTCGEIKHYFPTLAVKLNAIKRAFGMPQSFGREYIESWPEGVQQVRHDFKHHPALVQITL